MADPAKGEGAQDDRDDEAARADAAGADPAGADAAESEAEANAEAEAGSDAEIDSDAADESDAAAGSDDESEADADAEGVAGDDGAQTAAGETAATGDAEGAEEVSEKAPEVAPEEAAPPQPGAVLREAREARGLDVTALARTLNLPPRTLEALEADDDSGLPAPTFVRGYLRSYARLMGVDPEPLLARYDERSGGIVVGVHPSPRIETAPERIGIVQQRPGLVMTIASVLLVAAIALVFFLLRPQQFGAGEDAVDAPASPGSDAGEADPRPAARAGTGAFATADGRTIDAVIVDNLPEPVATDADALDGVVETPTADELISPDAVDAVPAAPDGATEAVTDDAASPAEALLPADGAASNVPLSGPPTGSEEGEILRTRTADGLGLRIYAGGEEHLHLAFTEDCWVEIRDADERDVFADLLGDGEVLELWGRAPFRIRLGYAPAATLTYNGSRVALRPHTRNDVASLTLGR